MQHMIAAMALSLCLPSDCTTCVEDNQLNRDSILAKWFDFYSTEMDELVDVFDKLLNKLTEAQLMKSMK